MRDAPTLFGEMHVQRAPLRQAERLLLLALPDHHPGERLAGVRREDEATCRRLLKRDLVVIRLAPKRHPGDRPEMTAARLSAALPLISD